MFEWEHGTREAFGVRQMGERIMHEHTSSSNSFTHNWVIHKHGVMELQPDLKCLFNTFCHQWQQEPMDNVETGIYMSGGLKDEFLSILLFLYFFQKPVRASAEKKNAFSSNLWACLDDCSYLYVFFFPNCSNHLLPNVQICILRI